jgi:hypothetical protein
MIGLVVTTGIVHLIILNTDCSCCRVDCGERNCHCFSHVDSADQLLVDRQYGFLTQRTIFKKIFRVQPSLDNDDSVKLSSVCFLPFFTWHDILTQSNSSKEL